MKLPYSMLVVQCKLKDKKIHPRPLIDKICEQWRNGGIPLKNELHKISLGYTDNSQFVFSLEFATWNKYYLTGKIII